MIRTPYDHYDDSVADDCVEQEFIPDQPVYRRMGPKEQDLLKGIKECRKKLLEVYVRTQHQSLMNIYDDLKSATDKFIEE